MLKLAEHNGKSGWPTTVTFFVSVHLDVLAKTAVQTGVFTYFYSIYIVAVFTLYPQRQREKRKGEKRARPVINNRGWLL